MTATKMNGANALLEALERQGVKHVFGILGEPSCQFTMRSAPTRKSAIYSPATSRAQNMQPTVMQEHQVNQVYVSPHLVQALPTWSQASQTPHGQQPSHRNHRTSPCRRVNSTYMIGRDAFQEADIIGITTPITKYNVQLRSVSEIPSTVNSAFYIASTGRPGPVLIDFPRMFKLQWRSRLDRQSRFAWIQPNDYSASTAGTKSHRPFSRGRTTRYPRRRRGYLRRCGRRTAHRLRIIAGTGSTTFMAKGRSRKFIH